MGGGELVTEREYKPIDLMQDFHMELAATLGANATTHQEMHEALVRARRLVFVRFHGPPPEDPAKVKGLMEAFKARCFGAGRQLGRPVNAAEISEAWQELPEVKAWNAYHDACKKFEEQV